ncbi:MULTISPECIES: zinc-binding dehydrogenase [unclassified Shinella]|uniref:zinc-binding dehydrogenase n=1 Tax=unclassified Shinella TaxID=2643062 RepID=UPI00234E7369|nr:MULTISPECIES: zinc-binding dehydrogenase [unclassified Shinella]
MVHLMPEGLSDEQGALVEPSAVALQAVRNSSIKPGGKAAVFGDGPIGLLVAESLRAACAAEIYVVEVSEQRAAKGLELGATAALDPTKEAVVERIKELTHGDVDVAFEVTDVPVVLQQAIDSTRYEGETVIFSLWEKPAIIETIGMVFTGKVVRESVCYRDIFSAVMDLMWNRFSPAEKLATKRITLDNIVEKGLRRS